MFAYCLNNPVNGADPSGQWMWYLDEHGEGHEAEQRSVVKYKVPLYAQKETNLCWAFSMVMRWSFDTGSILSSDEALNAAIRLGERYHPIIGWNHGLPFFMQGRRSAVQNIEDLYFLVKAHGPVYAAYRYRNFFGGHIVLVTGVDLDRGYVYTNNPWGIRGAQTEAEFFSSFVNFSNEEEPGYWLSGIYIPE